MLIAGRKKAEAPRLVGMPQPFVLSAGVADAIAVRRPVVALEFTIVGHVLPRPCNHEAVVEFESILCDSGVTLATIAVLDGVARIRLDADGNRRIAQDPIGKASVCGSLEVNVNVNVDLARNNGRVAARIATAWEALSA